MIDTASEACNDPSSVVLDGAFVVGRIARGWCMAVEVRHCS